MYGCDEYKSTDEPGNQERTEGCTNRDLSSHKSQPSAELAHLSFQHCNSVHTKIGNVHQYSVLHETSNLHTYPASQQTSVYAGHMTTPQETINLDACQAPHSDHVSPVSVIVCRGDAGDII